MHSMPRLIILEEVSYLGGVAQIHQLKMSRVGLEGHRFLPAPGAGAGGFEVVAGQLEVVGLVRIR